MESYKERKANFGQTLTGFILVRARILGFLMPGWEDCYRVVNRLYKLEALRKGW